MGIISYLNMASLFGSGILAGCEVMVYFGLRSPIATLDQAPHIGLRKALILRLRVLTPIVFVFAFVSGLGVVLIRYRMADAISWQLASDAFLLAFISFALFGTVPINKDVLTWDPVNPPADWQEILTEWEKLDSVRCFCAVGAFGCGTVSFLN